MRVLVTRGAGLVGRQLIPELVEDGRQIRALARSPSFRDKPKALGASPIDADVESCASLSLPAIYAVVHAAAQFRCVDIGPLVLAGGRSS